MQRFRVHRIISEWDAAGWRPSQTDLDRFGRAIPDDEYQTKDFERVIAQKGIPAMLREQAFYRNGGRHVDVQTEAQGERMDAARAKGQAQRNFSDSGFPRNPKSALAQAQNRNK